MNKTIAIFLSNYVVNSAFGGIGGNINNCNISESQRIVSEYELIEGEIMDETLRQAEAEVGNVSTKFEYIVTYALSYIGTGSNLKTPGEPVNLATVEDLDGSLSYLTARQAIIKDRFKSWTTVPECMQALKYNYDNSFKNCMSDYYPIWQVFFKSNSPAKWDAESVGSLFLRWALMNSPGKASCASDLTKIFLNDN